MTALTRPGALAALPTRLRLDERHPHDVDELAAKYVGSVPYGNATDFTATLPLGRLRKLPRLKVPIVRALLHAEGFPGLIPSV